MEFLKRADHARGPSGSAFSEPAQPSLFRLSAPSSLLPTSPFIHSFIPKDAELLPKAFRRAVPWPGTFFLHSLLDGLLLILPLGSSVLLSPAPAPAAHSFILFVAVCTTVGSMTWGLLPLHRLSRGGCHQCLGDESTSEGPE